MTKLGGDLLFEHRRALAIVGPIYLVGVVWRVYHLFFAHRATEYVYSDMAGYLGRARDFADPSHAPTIIDSLYPPGTHMLFGTLYGFYPSGGTIVAFQCVLSILIPLLIGAIGWELYGKRAALIGLSMSSLYFPFIDYAGFFLSENPFLFSMLLAMWLALRSLKVTGASATLGVALASGMMLGAAIGFRANVLLPAAFAGAGLVVWAVTRRSLRAALVIAGLSVGVVSVVGPMADRCTSLAEGRFCLVSTNGGMNVLLGHYGDLRVAEFVDLERDQQHAFSLPVAIQQPDRYRATRRFYFGAYDSDLALDYARRWIREHPVEALSLSLSHVANLFTGSVPWPSSATNLRGLAMLFQRLFLVLVALPGAIYLLGYGGGARRRPAEVRFADMALLLPIVGLVATSFLVHGSPRMRIPFDGFFILLAANGYAMAWSSWVRRHPTPRHNRVHHVEPMS